MKPLYISLSLAILAITQASAATKTQVASTPGACSKAQTVTQAQAMGLLPGQQPEAEETRSGITARSYSETSTATGYGYGLSSYIAVPLSSPTTAVSVDTNSVKVLAGARLGTDLYFMSYELDSDNDIHPLNLYKRDINTGSTSFVTAMDYDGPIVIDMAYSAMTGKMYCLGQDQDGNNGLYTIDMDNGTFSLVGKYFDARYYALAANRAGMLYAVTSTVGLVTINPLSANIESIGGSLGYTAYYICSMDYDLTTETLYWALCTSDALSYLIKIDPETGTSKLVGKIGSSTEEVIAFNISLPEQDSNAPSPVDSLTLTAGAAGATTVTVAWTNPSTTVGGTALDTLTCVQVSVNGTLYEEITGSTAGAACSLTLSGVPTGYITVRVVALNGSYSSEPEERMVWIGQDTPREPSNIALTRTSGKVATLTWDPPTESVHGGYLNTSSLKYRITRFDYNGDSIILAKTYKQDNCYLDSTITTLGRYYYKIQSLTSDYGMWDTSDDVLLGPAIEMPYTTTFSSEEEYDMWEKIDNNNDGYAWTYFKYGTPYLYNRGWYIDSDDWLVSPPLHFEADSTYYVYLEAYTGSGEYYPKHFYVTLGPNSDPTLNDEYIDFSFASKDTEQLRFAFPTSTDGEYYLAIHDVSSYTLSNLRIPTISIQTKHTAWLTGKVTDTAGNPVEGVTVELIDDSYNNMADTTATDGSYTLDFIPTGTWAIEYSKIGWETETDTLNFTAESETVNNVTLTSTGNFTLAGVVEDVNGKAIVNGRVTISGYGDDVVLATDSTGGFSATGMYQHGYRIDVDKVKYFSATDTIDLEADTTITFTMSPKLLAPSELTATATDAAVTLTWNEPLEIFRHDDGTMYSQLGSLSGDEKYVNGAVYRMPASLKSMSWMTTSYQGPHEEMNIWVFDVTEDYEPTNTVLFNAMSVAQEDEVWNYYEFPDAVECPRGFFLGVSYSSGMSSLAIDTGADEEYPFVANRNYSTSDYTTNVWSYKSAIKKNHLIRATGNEPGDSPQTYDYRYRVWRIAEENIADKTLWTLLTSNDGTADHELTDNTSDVESGNYYYAVEAVYPDDEGSLAYTDLITIESSGVTVAQLASKLTAMPVPASETLWLNMECDKVEILTLGGATALTTTAASSLNVTQLADGIYLLRATVGTETAIKQIIIKK